MFHPSAAVLLAGPLSGRLAVTPSPPEDSALAQVAYVDLPDVAAAALRDGATDAEPGWRGVLMEFGQNTPPGKGAFETLYYSFLMHTRGPPVALVFDECDALLEMPAIFTSWVQGLRSLASISSKSR